MFFFQFKINKQRIRAVNLIVKIIIKNLIFLENKLPFWFLFEWIGLSNGVFSCKVLSIVELCDSFVVFTSVGVGETLWNAYNGLELNYFKNFKNLINQE